MSSVYNPPEIWTQEEGSLWIEPIEEWYKGHYFTGGADRAWYQ